MSSRGGVSDTRQQKMNLMLCGSDETLKNSVSKRIREKKDVELHGRQISLVELPALFNTRLSEEEVMRQTLRCVSLCDPGVHVFLLIIPDGPHHNEDKAEMEEIQRIFSSRINKHMMILIMQNSEHQTEELNEETQSVIERFGGRHHFFVLNTQVSTLMENIEKMLEENRGEFFSTETFLEAQMKKLMKYEEMKKKIHSLETHLLPQGSRENTDEVRIVLLGKTGVGKSATGNTILGRDAFTAETSHRSVTKESLRETSEIDGRHVTVIDTPGLFDTELTNEEIQREIRHCISMILPGPHVFIIVLNLGQRFTREEATSVKIIQETFGEKSLMFTMVLFTRGDDLKNKTIEQCLGKPGSALMNLIEACGKRYHVFNNNHTGDRTQVSDLLEKIDNMVTANGGSFYSCKMFRQMEREKQEQQMKILMDRVREREEEMDQLKEEMKREQEKYKNKTEPLKQEKEKVKTEKEKLQIKHDNEIDRLRNKIENERKKKDDEFTEREEQYKTLKKEKEELMKKHEEEKEIMKMMMEEERQIHDEERKRREEEFREREKRYKRIIKDREERENEILEQMKLERMQWEKQKQEEKQKREDEEKKEKQTSELHKKQQSPVSDHTSMSKKAQKRFPNNIQDIPAFSPGGLPRRIVLLGRSGFGKSAAGNTILGQKMFKSDMRMNSVTRECSVKHATVSGRSVSVADTPGFFHSHIKNQELVKEMVRSVYLSSPGPHAFLIVFIINGRYTFLEHQVPRIIEMLFGKEVLNYSIILFTHGDLLGESVEELIKQNGNLQNLVDLCGGRYHVFNNKDENNREQVNDLLQKIDTMIEQNGGGHYNYQLVEDIQRLRWRRRQREEEERRQREKEERKQQQKQNEECVCS